MLIEKRSFIELRNSINTFFKNLKKEWINNIPPYLGIMNILELIYSALRMFLRRLCRSRRRPTTEHALKRCTTRNSRGMQTLLCNDQSLGVIQAKRHIIYTRWMHVSFAPRETFWSDKYKLFHILSRD